MTCIFKRLREISDMNSELEDDSAFRDSAFLDSYHQAMQNSAEDPSIANTSLDLLEEHQAKEQKRLLQRFKELRQWQQQQQEQLMLQQQRQLKAWQEEQSKVQTLIATQRGSQWNPIHVLKPSAGGNRSPIMTPPSKPRNANETDSFHVSQSLTAGISLDSGLVSMQDTFKSQLSTLPRPVMYIDPNKPLNPNDEDRYTNSELFSNPGSHEDQLEILKEDPRQVPDWMSDSSENFTLPKLPPPRPLRGGLRNGGVSDQLAGLEHLLSTAPAGLLQQVLNFFPGKERTVTPPMTSSAVELSASPTLPGPGQQSRARKLQYDPSSPPATQTNGSLQQQQSKQHQMKSTQPQMKSTQPQKQPAMNSVKSAQVVRFEQHVFEYENDPRYVPRTFTFDDGEMGDHRRIATLVATDNELRENGDGSEEEVEDDDEYSEEDEQNITAKEVSRSSHDDRPIRGAGDSKSFEQLLEEKLNQEEAKARFESQGTLHGQRSKTFLKKGEGTSRFQSAPKKPVRPPANTSKRKTVHAQQSGPGVNSLKARGHSGGQPQPLSDGEEGNKRSSVGSRLKTLSKSTTSLASLERKAVPNGPKAAAPSPADQSGKLTLIRNAANRKLEEQKSRQKDGGMTAATQNSGMDHISQIRQTLMNSVQRSPSLESRSTHGDHDMVELDSLAEFELLEDAVDNISFCSNSSLVRKLLTTDKMGHKEVMDRLKSKSEMKRLTQAGTREAGSEFRLEEADRDEIGKVDDFITNENSNNNANNRQRGRLKSESTDRTLTDSSEEDNDYAEDKMLSVVPIEDNVTSCPSMTIPDDAYCDLNQNVSPSKFMTRKIATMSSKFGTANNTLSMLKALSLQAGILTSGAAMVGGKSLQRSSPPQQPPSTSLPPPQASFTTSQPGLASSTTGAGSPPCINATQNQLAPEGYFTSSANTATSDSTATNCNIKSSFSVVSQSTVSQPQQTFLDMLNSGSRFPITVQFPSEINAGINFQTRGQAAGGTVRAHPEISYNRVRYGEDSNSNSDGESDGSKDYNHYEDTSDSDAQLPGDEIKGSDRRKDEEKEMKAATAVKEFDDETSWGDEEDDMDEETCLKSLATTVPSEPVTSTPPTSKLVARLFPKLKPKPNADAEKASQALHQATAKPQTADGVQSHILREKLNELDAEIENFRSENANLEKLRREREEGLRKLKQEIESFQREKEVELKRLEEYKNEELKKLKKERKLFDSYQKKIRSMPDKKDREEIDALRTQLQELQDELKRKESRWNASTARLKNRLAEVELENGELREEVRILEKKRLEWMTAQSSVKSSAQQLSNGKSGHGETSLGKSGKQASSQPRSSTPTKEVNAKAPGSSGHRDMVQPAAQATSARSAIPITTSAITNKAKTVNNHLTPSSNHNGLVAPPSSRTAGLKPLASASQAGLSGEIMQTQNTFIPVMTENVIPSGTHESSMPGAQHFSHANPGNTSAAILAMERAVVDKGDVKAFVESRHPEGKIEKTYKTGAKEISFPNGTIKEISADGQTIVCRLANGDIRQIFPDHRVVYIFAEAEILQTTFPDGLETFQFKNGQTEKRYPDGTVEITFPSKDVKYLFPDGGQEVILTDGTVMQYNSKGERTVEYPSGDREVHTAEYQRREFPDGIVKTVYADGRHETRFPNGRVRMRDKDGNVIMDQIVHR